MNRQEAEKHFAEHVYPFDLSHMGFPEQDPVRLDLTTAQAAALLAFLEDTTPSMVLEAVHPEFLGWFVEEIMDYGAE